MSDPVRRRFENVRRLCVYLIARGQQRGPRLRPRLLAAEKIPYLGPNGRHGASCRIAVKNHFELVARYLCLAAA